MQTAPRKVGWFDIYVDDIDRARAFHETVLDTTLSPMTDPNDPIVTDTEGNVIGLHSVSAPVG